MRPGGHSGSLRAPFLGVTPATGGYRLSSVCMRKSTEFQKTQPISLNMNVDDDTAVTVGSLNLKPHYQALMKSALGHDVRRVLYLDVSF